MIEALIADMNKVQAARRLRQLRERVGARPLLAAVCTRLDARARMRCPRCGLEFRRPEMIDHLWREHGLVLDGPRACDPWDLIEEWLDPKRGALGPAVLARCRALAAAADPERGSARVARLVLRAGVRDADAQQALLAEAKRDRSSLCPACFAAIPVPHPVPPPGLNHWRGRLSARGYVVELSEEGLRSRLELITPRGALYRGPEPGRPLTRRAALWLYAGPLVLLALAVAVGAPPFPGAPLVPVLLLLAAALSATAGVLVRWRPRAPLLDRTVDYAWSWMAPRLPAGGFSLADTEFLAGLALSSAGRGSAALRRPSLTAVINLTEQAVAKEPHAAAPLAALRRLAIHDAVAGGKDPVPLVVAELADCLEGRLPLAFGEALLNEWKTDWWTPGNLGRLRVLLCDRAFEAGFEVSHLLEIGQSYEALGAVLEVADARGLGSLRLLWSMRASRPWDRAGEARTVFEWAESPDGGELLNRFPDLLLVHEDPAHAVFHAGGDERPLALRLVVCARGVALQGHLFERRPPVLEVVSRGLPFRGHHELRVGEERFRFASDPGEVAVALDRWFRFLFNEFLPQSTSVVGWRSPDLGAQLRARGAIPCPGCGLPVLPRAGAVGKTLYE